MASALISPPEGFFGDHVVGGFARRDIPADPRSAAELLGLPGDRVVFPRQAHTARVLWIDRAAPGETPVEPADAVVTPLRSFGVGIITADCVPVLVSDRKNGIIGAVHAGWRGTAAKILHTVIREMAARAGTDSASVAVAVGPAIGPCCYRVGPEVRAALDGPEGAGAGYVDLQAINAEQAREAGVPAESIWTAGFCTRCSPDLFHSYRRDGAAAGRQMSVIAHRL